LYLIPVEDAWFVRIEDYLPDGLWAFSFMSSILLVNGTAFQPFWITMVFSAFVVFEVLQKVGYIGGTGDFLDVLCYFFFAGMAMLAHKKSLFMKEKMIQSRINTGI